jgi:hypothetical protein
MGKPKAEICAKVSLQVTYVGRTDTLAYVITVTPVTATAQKNQSVRLVTPPTAASETGGVYRRMRTPHAAMQTKLRRRAER